MEQRKVICPEQRVGSPLLVDLVNQEEMEVVSEVGKEEEEDLLSLELREMAVV